jgi:glutathione S-transferase
MSEGIVTLFHAPHTRSLGVLTLLEELRVPYEVELCSFKNGGLQTPEFLAINPMAKVPALRDEDGEIVTEQVAILLHLADLFPRAGLAPQIGEPARGRYLRWMVFYAASFEPAIVDHALKRTAGMRAMSPYGEFETVMSTLRATLAAGPYVLGEDFSAADVLWATALEWTMKFKVVPEHPEFVSYVKRLVARPAFVRAREKDAAFALQQGETAAIGA